MVISTSSIWDEIAADVMEGQVVEYEDATVYGDRAGEAVLHEGAVRVLPNGWVAVPTGRMLSPDAVHHIDP